MPRALVQRGTACDRKTVAKVMRASGIQSQTSRKFRVTTTNSNHAHPVAENVLARKFTAEKPNQKWVADTTFLATVPGWLSLAVVLDLFRSAGAFRGCLIPCWYRVSILNPAPANRGQVHLRLSEPCFSRREVLRFPLENLLDETIESRCRKKMPADRFPGECRDVRNHRPP